MYNSWDSRKSPLMGFNMKQPWCSTLKRGLHNDMTSFITFPSAPIGAKYFNNPNFVNENNPSLLRHPDFYKPVTKLVSSTTQKSPVESSQQKPPEMKKKRKRKRRNRKKNKKTSETVKTDESPLPELTKSFKSISVQPSCEVEVAKNAFRTRVPSVCESEDSFIVFDDRGAEEDKESAIESDEEVVVEESTEVSENEGMSSDCCIPHKKVRFANDRDLCEVHPMVQWSYAYQAARKGPWEQYARDRERFNKRIREIGKALNSILDPLHREKIFSSRFNNKENFVLCEEQL